MRLLISGATGYIGSSLVIDLVEKGYDVGLITRSKSSSLQQKYPQLDWYMGDLTKELNFNLLKPYDLFIHLAAANDVDSKNPKTALNNTVLTTKNCLEFCKINQINKFVYFSTFQVYGYISGDMSEEAILKPKNDYGLTHFFAEEYVRMYARNTNIDFVIFRVANIFGMPSFANIDRWSLVPNCFCEEAFKTQRIVLKSSGKQTRDFIDLNDLIGFTERTCLEFDRIKNNTINVNSGNQFSILEIAKMVQEEYQKMFKSNCELVVESDFPKETNKFRIFNKNRLVDYNFSDRQTIKKHIASIFKMLKSV